MARCELSINFKRVAASCPSCLGVQRIRATVVFLPSSGLRVCKLYPCIHSTAPCLATIGVSASTAQPSHCLRLTAICVGASLVHPSISARASLVHPSNCLCPLPSFHDHQHESSVHTSFPQSSSCNYQLSSLSRDTEPFWL